MTPSAHVRGDGACEGPPQSSGKNVRRTFEEVLVDCASVLLGNDHVYEATWSDCDRPISAPLMSSVCREVHPALST